MIEAMIGLAALAVILWLHGGYTWKQAGRPEVTGGAKTLLIVTAVLSAAALIAGVVGFACHLEGAMVHFMGLLCLLLSLWASYQIRRICGK